MTGTWALNLFDRLHLGHQVLIDRICDLEAPVAAVTDGQLMGQELELASIIQPAQIRIERLRQYLIANDLDRTITIEHLQTYHQLMAIEGTTTFMMYQGPCCIEIEARGLDLRREKMGLNDKLKFLPPVRAQDGEKLSSARIRKGEIDKQGYRLKGTSEPPRRLEIKRRQQLKTPKGTLFHTKDGPPEKSVISHIDDKDPEIVIAVGDVTSTSLVNSGYLPDVCIIDGITKRGPFESEIQAEKKYEAYNPPAVLYPEAWSVIATAIEDQKKSVITIDGEEDLLGFPAVLLAPSDSVMLYGQPGEGIVWVDVNEENKSLARELLMQMPIID